MRFYYQFGQRCYCCEDTNRKVYPDIPLLGYLLFIQNQISSTNMLRKNLAVLLVFLLFVPTVWGQSGKDGIEGQVISRVVKAENKISERPKNLILFISDGAGPAHFTM